MWCPHDLRCFGCDEHSCDRCRLVRGDGEAVESLVLRALAERPIPRPSPEATDPNPASQGGDPVGSSGLRALCVDFDRTLASTRSGGSPLVGAHTADAELLSAVCAAASEGAAVAVVTRNSHVQDIESFLAQLGVPPSVRVLHVSKGVSKGAVMAAHGLIAPRGAGPPQLGGGEGSAAGGGGGLTIFVDDSVDEHVSDPLLASDERVLRVLFTRGPRTAEQRSA
mmetsp:Transcript_43213/g.106716  ORF Transcript_43213/g.106716 Transcript_43213/m.106716 type:complete len:224 (+) Transcript_43213:531-1202(+)